MSQIYFRTSNLKLIICLHPKTFYEGTKSWLLYSLRIFSAALTDGFSLKYEWQQLFFRSLGLFSLFYPIAVACTVSIIPLISNLSRLFQVCQLLLVLPSLLCFTVFSSFWKDPNICSSFLFSFLCFCVRQEQQNPPDDKLFSCLLTSDLAF